MFLKAAVTVVGAAGLTFVILRLGALAVSAGVLPVIALMMTVIVYFSSGSIG